MTTRDAALADLDALERSGALAAARDRAIELGLLARASELALGIDGIDRAEQLARRAIAGTDADEARAASIALARTLLRKHGEPALVEAESLVERVLADVATSPHLRAKATSARATIHARRGRARDALETFDEAYRAAEGDPSLRAQILLAWSLQLRNFGLFEDAMRLVERSLELRLQLEDLYGAALCYGTIAFIAGRQGRHEAERDALVANLRLCERTGSTGDIPALRARLAGALVGMGKYAGAWSEAEAAIAAESARTPSGAAPASNTPGQAMPLTRTHGFAWREQARVCLVGGRCTEGLALVDKARAVFEQLRDPYAAGLVRITEAELAIEAGDRARARDAIVAARPAFVALGALPELAETLLLEVELEDRVEAVELLVERVLPALAAGDLAHSALYRRAKDRLAMLAPRSAFDRAATRAAVLRGLAAVAAVDGPITATVVAARVPAIADARRFVHEAVDTGAIVTTSSDDSFAALIGNDRATRARDLVAALAGLRIAVVTGTVELERLWPAGTRLRGEAIVAATRALDALPVPE